MVSDKGGGGVSLFLISCDKGWKGTNFKFSADKGGGGVWPPPFLPDIICEQPLIHNSLVHGTKNLNKFFLSASLGSPDDTTLSMC